MATEIRPLVLEVERQAVRSEAPSWTDAKIKRVSLSIFAAVCVIAGVALIGLSSTGVIPAPCGYLAIPLFLLAITSVCIATQILDYQDPVELQRMKDEAPGFTYRRLISKHGLSNVLNHDILPLNRFGVKFRDHIIGMTFKAFNSEFSIEDLDLLGRYSILSQGDLELLKNLKKQVEDKGENLRQIHTELDRKYPNRLSRELHRLKCEEDLARSKREREIKSVFDEWDRTIQKEINEIPRNQTDYQLIVQMTRSHREQQKTRAVANATERETTILNNTLKSIEARRDTYSQEGSYARQQTDLYNQEIENAIRENNRAHEIAETEFSAWLNPTEQS